MIGCIVCPTAQVLRAICNVLLKNIIRYIQISNLSQFMLRDKSKMAAKIPIAIEIWLFLQSRFTY